MLADAEHRPSAEQAQEVRGALFAKGSTGMTGSYYSSRTGRGEAKEGAYVCIR